MMIKVAVGKDLGVARTREIEWDKFATALTTHTQSMRKGGKFFVGGYFEGTERKEDSMVARTLLTLDIDDVDMSIEELELHLLMNIGCAFCAYSTYSHTPEKPRIRVVIPLSEEVTPNQYRDISHRFGDQLGLPLDACSYKPNQVMYMPSCPDTTIAWSIMQDGDAYQVEPLLALVPVAEVVDENNGVDDLESMLAEQPLDLTDEEINGWLLAYPAVGTDYDKWVMVGAALHHQFGGANKGRDVWNAWSAKDADRYDKDIIGRKWKSFGHSSKTVTFASVIFAAKEAGGFDAPEAADTFEAMLNEAEAIETLEEYREFKERITKLSTVVLHDDHRSMIAARIAKTFGKEQGITKGDIKKALVPRRRQREAESDVDVPAWLEAWVYCESTLEFVNTELDYAIKREGFNAKYDRETECVIAEMSAAQYALNVVKIQTVVDMMFWPGVGQLLEHEGKIMLNKYRDRGIEPTEDDEHGVVDRFLKHLEFTLPDAGDREIFLDWLCFVCQNPGHRVNWALLLQGSQGTGKTYFVNVLQSVLGRNVANLDPQAIAGRFTGWAHGSTVVAIEEIRIHGTNKFEILDRMKPFLTNDTVSIEEKGRDHRTVPNFTSYLLLTNHSDAIPLADGDRRYCVLYSHWQSEGQMYDELGGRQGAEKYFDALFDDLHESRVGALAGFLKTRKLSDRFSPRGRAPETKARQAMINLSISPERQMLEDALAEHECPIINDKILDVTWLNELCKMSDTDLPKSRALTAILLEMGFVQYDKRKVKINKTRRNHYVWLGRDGDQEVAPQVVRDFHDDEDFVPF